MIIIILQRFIEIIEKQGRKRPLDTPKRMKERNLPNWEIKRKERFNNYYKIISRNYYIKLSAEIITENYHRNL